ncbi:ubiquitin-associated domain-containing protein 1 [Colletes gigas]|uniref:ubiquitin-associated domain-containing protein 1 n=1 Tax=Colletes gigas TaxID=935657 RepID=UPI001C9B0519|nr:ubiquitin-associated domain-containing protein 1 [Colletes gigas]
MFKSTTILSENFPINVISLEGNITDVFVKPSFTIGEIKTIAINHFYGHDTAKMLLQFRLIHSSKFTQLVDDHNINDEKINKYDTLILVEIRTIPVKENLFEDALKGPNEEAILQVTNNLPVRNPPRPISSIECPADFQNEVQKILITLVKASAKILMHSSETQKFYNILKEKLKARCKPTIDPNAVDTLMKMGYSHTKILKALRLRKSNLIEALGWLMEHQNDPDDDDYDDDLDLVSNEKDNYKYVADPSSPTSAKKKSFKDACIELFKGESQNLKNDGNLIEMGFEENSIIDALKITGNNQTNACEWLLGERRRSLQDLGEGLDLQGPIYKAIINNPHIQLSLTNPKMLLVYLSILETPTSMNVWINDPEVSLIINRIHRIYHAEKYAIQMNRYAAN